MILNLPNLQLLRFGNKTLCDLKDITLSSTITISLLFKIYPSYHPFIQANYLSRMSTISFVKVISQLHFQIDVPFENGLFDCISAFANQDSIEIECDESTIN